MNNKPNPEGMGNSAPFQPKNSAPTARFSAYSDYEESALGKDLFMDYDLDLGLNSSALAEENSKPQMPSSYATRQTIDKSIIFLPICVLLTAVVIVAFILPTQPVFSHEIEIDENYSSPVYTVAEKNEYIAKGSSGEKVTLLQKALYELGELTYDDINGKFDEATLQAVNGVLADNAMEAESNSCSDESYKFILNLAENSKATTQPTETPNNTESDPITDTETDPAEGDKTKMIRITTEITKVRREPKQSGTALFNANMYEEYKIIEEAVDEQGRNWYRIIFYYTGTNWVYGWINGDDAAVFFE